MACREKIRDRENEKQFENLLGEKHEKYIWRKTVVVYEKKHVTISRSVWANVIFRFSFFQSPRRVVRKNMYKSDVAGTIFEMGVEGNETNSKSFQ